MENQFLNTVKNKRSGITIAAHVLVWFAVFTFPYFINPYYEPEPHVETSSTYDFRDFSTVTKFFWMALFYFNAFVLTPRFVYRRQFAIYALSLLGIYSGILLIFGFLFRMMMQGQEFTLFPFFSYYNFILFIFTIALSTAYKFISDQIRFERLLSEKQNENLKTELSFLRSQISPHFLFNVMNNIVAMVRLKSDELEPTVMKLSSLMQYMLYETDEEKVLLKSEAEYLQSYIDLQKQRFGPELILSVSFDLKEDWHTIEPMLLIPFVENAFKHGTSLSQQPEIDIRLSAVNNQVHLTVKNKYEESTAVKDKTSGIGLTNVKRRLELLYPNKHDLVITKKEGWFTIDLHITLK